MSTAEASLSSAHSDGKNASCKSNLNDEKEKELEPGQQENPLSNSEVCFMCRRQMTGAVQLTMDVLSTVVSKVGS